MPPHGLPRVVALEVPQSRRSSENRSRAARARAAHVSGKPALGRASHPWRTSQVGLRGRSIDRVKIHAPEQKTSFASWKTFLHNHADGIAAVDFLVVPTLTFERLFVFVVLGITRRSILWIGVTANPTAQWLARQITEAFPWDTAPAFLIRDNDGAYGEVFRRRLRAMGIRDRPIAPRSPWQNGHVERVIGSIRRECLDHVIVRNEAHLRRVLHAYSQYYNVTRTHLARLMHANYGF